MKTAVYAGSFDPVTNGHLWVMEEGSRLFNHLIVAVGYNPEKAGRFSLEDRLAMLRESIPPEWANIEVDQFINKYLVRYAQTKGAEYLLRGVRNEGDYRFERGMQWMNLRIDPNIKTVFVFPPTDVAEISSSMVDGLVGPEDWEETVASLVPPPVFKKYVQRRKNA